MQVERVMERVYDRRRLSQAWQTVRSNAGAAGIDHMTVEDFATPFPDRFVRHDHTTDEE